MEKSKESVLFFVRLEFCFVFTEHFLLSDLQKEDESSRHRHLLLPPASSFVVFFFISYFYLSMNRDCRQEKQN